MEKIGLRVLRGRVGVSDPEPSNLATEATEMEYKCVTYSRRQFVRLLDGTTSCIQFFRGQGETVQVQSATGDTSKKNQSDAALAIWKYVPGAHEITDAKRLDQSVSPHYFGSNDDGSVCLLWWKEAPAPVWKQDRIQQNKL